MGDMNVLERFISSVPFLQDSLSQSITIKNLYMHQESYLLSELNSSRCIENYLPTFVSTDRTNLSTW